MNKEKQDTIGNDRDSSIVGHITGGVLHDFNNVLQGIIGLAEMLDADPSVPEKAKISMKAIRRLGQNATQMVQNLGDDTQVYQHDSAESVDTHVSTISEPTSPDKLSILIAEDDPLVLNVVTGMLKHLGYSTLVAKDGVEAFQVYTDNIDRIGMIITDMAMPRLGGLELAAKILAVTADAKIIVMTGYLQEELEIRPEEFGLAGWLEKPMTAERIRQVVDPIMKT
jgi:CheY-like chemotaxis protein